VALQIRDAAIHSWPVNTLPNMMLSFPTRVDKLFPCM
jgi:hypothetical protein